MINKKIMGEKMKKIENETLRQKTHNSVDRIMDKAESVGESGKEAIVNLKEKAILMKGNVDDYIKENPERSVLIAAGVGAVVGVVVTALLMRRRN
ncbi:hypothetical protein COV13_00820 [Candidatus Woesearchaeota archaeon CG10_big_fil_rev_8_21_14_0_10_32_9]|nr:MAG: hypothetical protein COV13_00820 [Candidatus Woesearchaeota archaeon CG10_big_fil_rev_8_21_14_0_10_32_9]